MLARILTRAMVVAAAGSLAALGLAAAPASASIEPNAMCLFKDVNFQNPTSGGFQVEFCLRDNAGVADLRNVAEGGPWNDTLSSVSNLTRQKYCLYSDVNFSGGLFEVPSGAQFSDLRSFGFNDVTSSLRVC